MRNIKIGFSRPSTWKIGAEGIMLWMDSPYSHVYIRYQDDQKRDIVFQASHGNIHPRLYVNFLSDNICVEEFSLDFTDQEYQNMRDFYYNKMGELYAYKDLLIIFIHDLFRKVGIIFNEVGIPGYICSGLVATMLSEVKGVKWEKPINLIRPDDIYKYFEKKLSMKNT
jgi:hypothetical protein